MKGDEAIVCLKKLKAGYEDEGLSDYAAAAAAMERAMTATGIMESVKDDICSNYCKWPDLWDEEKEGMELWESEICGKCPLGRL